MALKTDDIFATMRALKSRSGPNGGFEFMKPASQAYYRCACLLGCHRDSTSLVPELHQQAVYSARDRCCSSTPCRIAGFCACRLLCLVLASSLLSCYTRGCSCCITAAW